jgi:hypothetical protein
MSHKAFAVTLQDLRDGRVHAELSQQFGDLVAKVRETGKGGEITLKIKVKPASRGADVEKVVVSDAISVTLPKPDRGEDFFYLTDGGDLSRNHPKQQSLELHEVVPEAPKNLKTI